MTKSSDSLQIEALNSLIDNELTKVNVQDREDIKQDALLKIFLAVQKQQIGSIKAFARVIVKRTIIDYYRKLNRLMDKNSFLVNFNDGISHEEGDSCLEYFCVQKIDYGFDIACIRIDYESNISRFTPREQEVVNHLLYNEEAYGMCVTDLANTLCINKSHVTRAVKKLRKICN